MRFAVVTCTSAGAAWGASARPAVSILRVCRRPVRVWVLSQPNQAQERHLAAVATAATWEEANPGWHVTLDDSVTARHPWGWAGSGLTTFTGPDLYVEVADRWRTPTVCVSDSPDFDYHLASLAGVFSKPGRMGGASAARGATAHTGAALELTAQIPAAPERVRSQLPTRAASSRRVGASRKRSPATDLARLTSQAHPSTW